MSSAFLRGRTLNPYAVAHAQISIAKKLESMKERARAGTATRRELKELRDRKINWEVNDGPESRSGEDSVGEGNRENVSGTTSQA
jgi:hypothetical protein